MIYPVPGFPGYCINETGELFLTKKLKKTSKNTFVLFDASGQRNDLAVSTLIKISVKKGKNIKK